MKGRLFSTSERLFLSHAMHAAHSCFLSAEGCIFSLSLSLPRATLGSHVAFIAGRNVCSVPPHHINGAVIFSLVRGQGCSPSSHEPLRLIKVSQGLTGIKTFLERWKIPNRTLWPRHRWVGFGGQRGKSTMEDQGPGQQEVPRHYPGLGCGLNREPSFPRPRFCHLTKSGAWT